MKDAARVLGMTFGEKLAHMLPKKGAKITHSKPVIPRRPGSWPATILIAEPVMKPVTAGCGMNSTSQPRRRRPSPRTMKPQRSDRVVAIICPS